MQARAGLAGARTGGLRQVPGRPYRCGFRTALGRWEDRGETGGSGADCLARWTAGAERLASLHHRRGLGRPGPVTQLVRPSRRQDRGNSTPGTRTRGGRPNPAQVTREREAGGGDPVAGSFVVRESRRGMEGHAASRNAGDSGRFGAARTGADASAMVLLALRKTWAANPELPHVERGAGIKPGRRLSRTAIRHRRHRR